MCDNKSDKGNKKKMTKKGQTRVAIKKGQNSIDKKNRQK